MQTPVDERLCSEMERFSFQFNCEECVHFAVETGACGNGFPNVAHRKIQLLTGQHIEFCKEFEIA